MTVAVVGAGPAGVAAAVGCARGGAAVVLLESLAPGGEALNVEEVTELPWPAADLRAGFRGRAHRAGPRARRRAPSRRGGRCRSTGRRGMGGRDAGQVVSTPTSSCSVPAPGRSRCRTDRRRMPTRSSATACSPARACDGPMYAGRRVAVAGGGDTGVEGALTLSRYADRVVVYERERELTAQPTLVAALTESATSTFASASRSWHQWARVSSRVSALGTGSDRTESADGLMVAVGIRPRTGLLEGVVGLGRGGWGPRSAWTSPSSAPGLFAAGDVRGGQSVPLCSGVRRRAQRGAGGARASEAVAERAQSSSSAAGFVADMRRRSAVAEPELEQVAQECLVSLDGRWLRG